jgi:hypothetical protein
MKRLLATVTIILFLSFPAYAGHVLGTGVYCDCGTSGCVRDYEGECGGHNTNQAPTDLGSGTLLFLAALLLGLKLRA